MSDRTYRFAAINRQLQRVAGDHEREVRKAWVDRVLNILDSDNLIAQAASGQVTENSVLFECNVAALVWDDPRIVYRLRQLEGSGVAAELVDHEHEVAGKSFRRTKILVTFRS
ncbi:MAG: hypothetical protein HC871_16015 [Rhizobiales bacterium]|nr:hypothetical protein [Hyphomicrobiales bacterium]